MEVLAQHFHNLEGITLHERKKNFNIYLNDIKKVVITVEDRKTYCNLLEPKNKLEEVLYTQILLELQDSHGLLNILTSNNVALRKMVLKSELFLEVLRNNFSKVTSEEFSKEICFLVRVRILVRFGQIFQDDERLDDYYLVTRRKFGLHLAKHLLPACKLGTITEEMQKNCVVFNNKQLTKLHDRFPNFLEAYFKHLEENNFKHFNIFDKVIRQIIQTDLDLYFKLLQRHELKTRLSVGSTIKFVEKYKEEVIKHGEKYLGIIHKRAAFRQLTLEEFPLLYAKLFPKSFNDVNVDLFTTANGDIIKSLVKRFSRKHRFPILNDVFNMLYNTNLMDHDELFTEPLLEIVPANLRQPIILKKMAKDNKDDWIIFYELEKALKILEEKISKTSDPTKRRNLVACMVKTCKVNNDIPRLAEVFDYIVTRHRNEDPALFTHLFQELYEMDTEQFTADHWDSLNKMCKKYLMTRQDNYCYSDYRLNKYVEGYWAYKIKNNLPIVEDITNYVKKYHQDYCLSIFQDKKYKQQRKIVLTTLAEILPDLNKALEKNPDFRSIGNFFLQTLVDSNRCLKSDKISIKSYPFLVKYIMEVLNEPADANNKRSYIFGILESLQLDKDSEVFKKVCNELWKEKPEYYEYKWAFFLKYHPQYIKENYEQFFCLTWMHSYVLKFIENVQYYSHLGIPELFYQKSKEILMGPEFFGSHLKYDVAVRFLVNSDEMLAIAERLLPANRKESNAVDEDSNLFQIKKITSEVFGNYKNLEDVLTFVLTLSKSDYLKYCLQSIYKIVYNLPESKLGTFIEEIASGKISLRKHVIFITIGISEQQKVYETLKTMGMNEKNASIQKYLVKSTLHYFNKNPSEEFFQLVKDHCKFLTDYYDSEGFDLLLVLDKIPIQYLSRYVEFIWQFTQSSNIDEVKDVKYKILQKLNEDLMKTLKPEFLDTLVTTCLDFEKPEADKMYDFINRYIIFGNLEDASKRVNFVVSQFPKIVTVTDIQLSKNLLTFTRGFSEKLFAEHKKNNVNAKPILIKFKKAWSRIYNLENSLEQAAALEFTEYFLETQTYNKSLLVQKVAIFFNNLLHKYGSYIIPNFAVTFRNQFYTLMKIQELRDDEELFKFMLEFLQVESNISQVDKEYFVLMSLPSTMPKATNAKEKHLKILESLEKSKTIGIKMNIFCYINSLKKKKENDRIRVPICNMRC